MSAGMDLTEIKKWRDDPLTCVSGRSLTVIDMLIAEVERLTRLTASLTNGEGLVCMDCDGTGWLENRVDGRYPCTCMTEAEPYQILIDLLGRIGRIANGEDQVADDDTEGMAHIANLVAEAVQS